MNNLLDILNKSVNYLEKKEIKDARLIVETILAEIFEVQRIMLYANFERILTEKELEQIRKKLNDFVEMSKKYSTDDVKKKEMEILANIDNNEKESESIKTVKVLLEKSIEYLEKNNVEENKLIAEIIISNILNVDRMMLFTKYREIVSDNDIEKIREYLKKIAKDKLPLQYLLNEQEFYGRKFYVNKGVLIPRQDTEILVEKAINIVKDKKIETPKILDIGSGSGVIGITMALEIENSKVLGIDVSDVAIEISNKNREILKAKNIKIVKSNLFENVSFKEFDMIISNPPYISRDEIDVMSENTLTWEPEEALFAENEGLYFYNEICDKGYEYLQKEGYLLFEIGYKQGEKVKMIMEKKGYKEIEIIKDLQGLDRVVVGRK